MEQANKKNKFSEKLIQLKQKNNFKKYFFTITFFVILLIAFLRIPYIGEFIDSVIFSFVFGWSKYLIYGFCFLLIILVWFNKIKKPLYSKRSWILLFITSFLLSCLFSSIQSYIADLARTKYINYYLDYWKNIVFPLDNKFNPFIYEGKIYVDGGILGVCITYLSNVIVMIISIIGIVVIYLLLANKHREKIIAFFKKKTNNKILNEFHNTSETYVSNNDNNKENEIKQFIVDHSYLKSIENDWKKKYLTLNNSQTNIFNIDELKNKINDFFINNHIDYIKSSFIDNDNSIIIEFLMDEESYNNFLTVEEFFSIAINNIEYETKYENNTLTLLFIKKNRFQNNLMLKNLNIIYKNAFEVAFLDYNNAPLIIDLKKNSFIGVFDPNDQNIYNLINNIILNLSWNYKTNQLAIYYLSTRNTKFAALKSPNCKNIDLLTTKDALHFFKQIVKEINELKKEFKKINVDDIYSYNSLKNEKIPFKVILVNDFNQMCAINTEIKNIIQTIANDANKYGISIITFDKSIDGITFNNLNYPITLLFKAPLDVSKKILNDNGALNLNQNNHAILSNHHNQKKFTVELPFLNDIDLKIILETLIKCYQEKNF